MADDNNRERDKIEFRLEKARKELFTALDALRSGTLSEKEADAVAAANEDELITREPFTRALNFGSIWNARGADQEYIQTKVHQ